MKNSICLIVTILICCTFQQNAFAQKQVKKIMKKAISNNTKVGKFYLAKTPKNKIIDMDMLTKYSKGEYIFQHVKFQKRIIYGEIKRVITSFQFRNIYEAQREESALLKSILRSEPRRETIMASGLSYSRESLVGTWKGEEISCRFYSDGTYKISDYHIENLGHWRLEDRYGSEPYSQIILSYAGIDLDSKFQIFSLEDGTLRLKNLSDNNYYTLNKEVKPSSSLSSSDMTSLFWIGLAAIILSSDGGSSSTSKGEYSNNSDVNRRIEIWAQEDEVYRRENQ